MKSRVGIMALAALAGSVLAADSPKDEVIGAARKLGDAPNYSWRTTVVVPESAQFKPGPTEGKTEKGGVTWVSMRRGDNESFMVLKGDKGALTNQEGDWQSLSELEGAEGFAQFRLNMARNFKAPAVQAAEAAANVKELKKDGEAYSGELSEDGAKALMRFGRGGRGGGGGDGPQISGAKGSIKFWIKDGQLARMQTTVKASMNINGNDIDIDRVSTVEIKDVGTTKVEIPAGAKSKL